jgi:hypothetical protein
MIGYDELELSNTPLGLYQLLHNFSKCSYFFRNLNLKNKKYFEFYEDISI